MSSIHESVQSLELGSNTAIVWVPCIAHVIQLSLKQLLRQMKATPKNEISELDLSDARLQAARVSAKQQKKGDCWHPK